jgi:hypothetical protein
MLPGSRTVKRAADLARKRRYENEMKRMMVIGLLLAFAARAFAQPNPVPYLAPEQQQEYRDNENKQIQLWHWMTAPKYWHKAGTKKLGDCGRAIYECKREAGFYKGLTEAEPMEYADCMTARACEYTGPQ